MRGPYWTGAVTPWGEDGSCQGAAGAAEAAMGAMFGDLEGARLGHIEDLPTDGGAVTVRVRQRRAAARAGGRVMIHDVVGGSGPRQGRSLVARLAATGPAGLAALALGAPLGSCSSCPDHRWRAACCWCCCRAPRSARARRYVRTGPRSPARAPHSSWASAALRRSSPGPICGWP